MSWVRGLSISAAATGALFALVPAEVSHADVVVAASGPSAAQFPTGKKLGSADEITLKVGDSVTVLGETGTQVISGAGIHRVGARGIAKRSTFALLTRQRAASRVRTGAVRGTLTDQPVTQPNIWYVDVAKSGTICEPVDTAVQLWRANTIGAPTYDITGDASPGQMHVAFADGAMTTDWDLAGMPLANGATYSIAAPGDGPASKVTFALIDTAPATPEELAEALISRGCTGQLDLLAAAMK